MKVILVTKKYFFLVSENIHGILEWIKKGTVKEFFCVIIYTITKKRRERRRKNSMKNEEKEDKQFSMTMMWCFILFIYKRFFSLSENEDGNHDECLRKSVFDYDKLCFCSLPPSFFFCYKIYSS